MAGGFEAHQQGDDAVPRTQLQQLILRPGLDKIRQQGGIHRKPESFLFLQDLDAPPIKGVKRLILTLYHLCLCHFTKIIHESRLPG